MTVCYCYRWCHSLAWFFSLETRVAHSAVRNVLHKYGCNMGLLNFIRILNVRVLLSSVYFVTISFYGEQLLAPCSYPLSSVCNCLFSIYTVIYTTFNNNWSRNLTSQLERWGICVGTEKCPFPCERQNIVYFSLHLNQDCNVFQGLQLLYWRHSQFPVLLKEALHLPCESFQEPSLYGHYI
jgi:hypothetical protein